MSRAMRRRRRHVAEPARRPLRRLLVLSVVAALVLALGGGGAVLARRLLGRSGDAKEGADRSLVVAAGATATDGGPGDQGHPSALASVSTPAVSPSTGTATPTATGADAQGLTAADRAAGLLAPTVPQRGTGKLITVPGSARAPGSGTVKRVRIEVEGGLDVDGALFADFVLDTLNDPHSWGHGGRMTFARTSGSYDIRVILASPDTSAALCAPLQTMGTLSCGQGSTAVLTLYRWVKATPDYGTDRTGYRHYVVNHEVGHTLGHGHDFCPGPGKVAPLMMQQTKGLKGCRPNPWPYP